MFIERYGAGQLICRLIKLVSENFTTEAKADEVETFFKVNAFPGSERTVQQAVEVWCLHLCYKIQFDLFFLLSRLSV